MIMVVVIVVIVMVVIIVIIMVVIVIVMVVMILVFLASHATRDKESLSRRPSSMLRLTTTRDPKVSVLVRHGNKFNNGRITQHSTPCPDVNRPS
jgi:hypothetical protein